MLSLFGNSGGSKYKDFAEEPVYPRCVRAGADEAEYSEKLEIKASTQTDSFLISVHLVFAPDGPMVATHTSPSTPAGYPRLRYLPLHNHPNRRPVSDRDPTDELVQHRQGRQPVRPANWVRFCPSWPPYILWIHEFYPETDLRPVCRCEEDRILAAIQPLTDYRDPYSFLYPHCGQKSPLAGSADPQLAQFGIKSMAAPHPWQNLAPRTTCMEHLRQIMSVGNAAGLAGAREFPFVGGGW
jgi:hypothetical protein